MDTTETLVIKNMVCPRCIHTVKSLLIELQIPWDHLQLGEVKLRNALTSAQRQQLSERLSAEGFELLEDRRSRLVAAIKTIVIEQVHHAKDRPKVNFSVFLSEKLNQEYTSLSRLFSSVEGMTIERFITLQKIERVKELIFYNEMSLSEIAFEMDYSSSAYLSSQFRKETGMTPSQFRKLKEPGRKPLDMI